MISERCKIRFSTSCRENAEVSRPAIRGDAVFSLASSMVVACFFMTAVLLPGFCPVTTTKHARNHKSARINPHRCKETKIAPHTPHNLVIAAAASPTSEAGKRDDAGVRVPKTRPGHLSHRFTAKRISSIFLPLRLIFELLARDTLPRDNYSSGVAFHLSAKPHALCRCNAKPQGTVLHA